MRKSVTIDTTVDINAGKDTVWSVLTDFTSYKEWNPAVRIEGAPKVGKKLVVHLTRADGHSFTLKPEVLAASPGKELRWLGKLGLRAIASGEHYFFLTTNDDGTTRLNHGERYSGALMKLAMRAGGEDAYEAFNQLLKARVEDRHGLAAGS